MTYRKDNPKAFISYSWSTQGHQAFVVDLAERLMSDGIHVILDKWDLIEGHDKYVFMETMVNDPEVSKVLVISDRTYASKADRRTGGVGTESQIISGEIYNQVKQEKFIPIVAEYEDGQPCLASFLKSRMYIDLANAEHFNDGYEKLLRNIYKLPQVVKPLLGKAPAFLFENPSKSLKNKLEISNVVESTSRGTYGLFDEISYNNNTIPDLAGDNKLSELFEPATLMQESELFHSELSGLDEVADILDLAKAYIDMDDGETARGMLNDVIESGTEEQKEVARIMIHALEKSAR